MVSGMVDNMLPLTEEWVERLVEEKDLLVFTLATEGFFPTGGIVRLTARGASVPSQVGADEVAFRRLVRAHFVGVRAKARRV